MPSARPNGGSVGGPSGSPVMRREAAHRLGQAAEAGPRRVRTDLAEAGDARDHEPRVDRVEASRAEAPALERAGPEVLDQHVGVGGERRQQVGALGLAEVERDRALVAAERLPPQGDAVLGRAVAARGVALGAGARP